MRKGYAYLTIWLCCCAGALYAICGLVTAQGKYEAAEKQYVALRVQKETVEKIIPADREMRQDILSVAMKQINPDYVAWIQVEDTVIDYPIVRDSPEKNYLHHDFYGEKSVYGTLFTSYGQSAFTDLNTIIFGHDMKNGSMFATLKRYMAKDWLDDHRSITIQYAGNEMEYKVFSVQIVPEKSQYPYTYQFTGLEEYKAFLTDMVRRSEVSAAMELNMEAPIITLSTCYGKKRLLVMAQEVR